MGGGREPLGEGEVELREPDRSPLEFPDEFLIKLPFRAMIWNIMSFFY